MDPAAFHQVLSNALLNISCRRTGNNFPETYDSIKHHSLTVKLFNERIPDFKSATLDGFIGAIIGFACYHVSYTSVLGLDDKQFYHVSTGHRWCTGAIINSGD
jgi:hypothetical protein